MEASRKPLHLLEQQLFEIEQQFPRDRFIWLNSPMIPAGRQDLDDWSITTRVFQVPTDGLAGIPPQNGFICEIVRDRYMLMKPALHRLKSDAMLSISSKRQIDGGANPRRCIFEATGMLMQIGGQVMCVLSRGDDLDILRANDELKLRTKPPQDVWINGRKIRWDSLSPDEQEEYIVNKVDAADRQRSLRFRESLETKTENRIIRSMLGIASAYSLEELRAKQFLTFCILYNPRGETPQERMLILQHHLNAYLPAFPGAGVPAVGALPAGEIEQPRQLPEGEPQRVEVIASPPDNGDEQELDQATDMEIEHGAPEPAPAPAPEPQRIEPDYNFLQAMGAIKKQVGEAVYYEVLRAHGYEHSNLVPDKPERANVYRALTARLAQNKSSIPTGGLPAAAPPAKPKAAPAAPAHPLQEYIDKRRASFERMAEDRLVAEIDAMGEDYPQKTDPLGIIPAYQNAKSKADLVDVATRLFIWTLDEAKRIREQHNATRGGER